MNQANKEGWNTIVAIFHIAMLALTAIITLGFFIISGPGGWKKQKRNIKYKVKYISQICQHEHDSVESAYKSCMLPNYDGLGDIVAVENNKLRRLNGQEVGIFEDVFYKKYAKRMACQRSEEFV